jgi:nucleoside-diphosphate-sugar epimerase
VNALFTELNSTPTPMTILVTGHKGYIGTVMVPMLIERGYSVVGLDTDLFAACSFTENGIASVPELTMDVRDVTAEDLEGVDAVIHLANLSNDPLGNLNPDLTYAINHRASVQLAKAAKAAGVKRFLFSSSCSLYGAAAGEDMLTEEAPFNPVTPYGEAKVLAERDLAPLADETFSPVYMRNATAYGMSPRLRFDLVLNNLVAWAITTGEIYMKSDGTPWRPIVHIEDISRAFIAALEAPREVVHNEAFNVGRSDENYQIREIAEAVRDVVPDCDIEYAPDGGPDSRSYRVDFSKIREALPDFEPRWTARRGAQEVYEALRDANLTPDEFEGPRYRRIDHIKQLISDGLLSEDLRWDT